MKKTTIECLHYPNINVAIGAFIAGEMGACIADPTRLLPDPDDDVPPGVVNTEPFNMWKFEKHLVGLLSDLMYYCLEPPQDTRRMDWNPDEYTGEVLLFIATNYKDWPTTDKEWQSCAQGHARMEAVDYRR